MEEAASAHVDRIGVVATDTLRLLGLQSILPQFEVIHLTAPGALDDVNLSLVLIDAECTNHLFELIATFHHIRPQLKLIVLGTETSPEYIQRIIGAGSFGDRNGLRAQTALGLFAFQGKIQPKEKHHGKRQARYEDQGRQRP